MLITLGMVVTGIFCNAGQDQHREQEAEVFRMISWVKCKSKRKSARCHFTIPTASLLAPLQVLGLYVGVARSEGLCVEGLFRTE